MTAVITPPAATATITPAIFDPLRADLEKYLIRRSVEIDTFILALVSKSHLFLLGSPGTAKSRLAVLAQQRIYQAVIYSALFTKFADDSLLFGPWSISGLRNDQRIRAGKGRYVQHAHFAIFDEAWKGTSALMNAMLQLLNERTFDDDGLPVSVPLCTALLLSNELPQQEHQELEAIYDRIEFRLFVDPLTDPDDLRKLLTLPDAPDPAPALLAWDDVLAAQDAAALVPVTPEADDAFIDILVKLAAQDIVPSGRRIAKMRRIAQAQAWLRGATEVGPGHLDFLCNTLWSDPKQRPTVNRIVLGAAAPLRGEAIKLADDVATLYDGLNEAMNLDDGDPDRNTAGAEIMTDLKTAARSSLDLETRTDAGTRDRDEVLETQRRINDLATEIQKKIYGVPSPLDLVQLAREGKL